MVSAIIVDSIPTTIIDALITQTISISDAWNTWDVVKKFIGRERDRRDTHVLSKDQFVNVPSEH